MAAKGKKQRITVDGTVLKIEYPTIRKSLTIDTAKFSDEVQFDAKMHGFKQKYGDAKSGQSATEKYEMTQRILAAHESGSWDVAAGVRDDSGIIMEAVSRVMNRPLDDIREAVDEYDDETREKKLKEWKTNGKVHAMIATIRAERAIAAAEDVDDEPKL